MQRNGAVGIVQLFIALVYCVVIAFRFTLCISMQLHSGLNRSTNGPSKQNVKCANVLPRDVSCTCTIVMAGKWLRKNLGFRF